MGMMSVQGQAALGRNFTRVENLDVKLSEDDDSHCSLLVFVPPSFPSLTSLSDIMGFMPTSVTMLNLNLISLRKISPVIK